MYIMSFKWFTLLHIFWGQNEWESLKKVLAYFRARNQSAAIFKNICQCTLTDITNIGFTTKGNSPSMTCGNIL